MAERAEPGYGLLAEFERADDLVAAARTLRAKGFTRIEGHTPFPVNDLPKALGFDEPRLPQIAVASAVLGGGGMVLLQWYLTAVNYPINVGGRPLDAWAAFAIPGVQVMILITVLATVFGMLWLNGLPRLHHPLFGAQSFERATLDRFLLSVGRDDPRFDLERTRDLLLSTGALRVHEVGS